MKSLKTILIGLIVILLAYFAYTLSKNEGNSKLSDEALSDFAIKDTLSIDKIEINDTDGNPGVSLVRSDGLWLMEGGDCIQQHLVNTMLETIVHISVKSPVSEGEIETVNKNLTAHHKRVDIYTNGQLEKTWYIGNPTKDQYGTYMLLKDPEKGKSPEPFVTYLPNMYGSLESRFITNPLEFQCTGIFNYEPLDIKSIDVKIADNSEKNFKIIALGDNKFSLLNNNSPVENFDTSAVRNYILFYKKIHFERHNYLITAEQEDSVLNTKPYYTIEVINQAGESNFVKCFRKGMMNLKYDYDGNLIEWDRDRLWLELNDGAFVVGQYHVFDKLLQDVDVFMRRSQ